MSTYSASYKYDSSTYTDEKLLIPINTDVSDIVSKQCNETTWLRSYGLAANRLDERSLMKLLGFKKIENYVPALRKNISSRYSENLFTKYEGYNQSSSLNAKLYRIVCLLEKRLNWLTSESRNLFGVITEKNVVLVLNCHTHFPKKLDTFLCAVEKLITQQLNKCDTFNVNCFSECMVSVNKESMESLIAWLWNIEKIHDSVDAMISQCLIDAVYFIAEGSIDTESACLMDVVRSTVVPLNVVSFCCENKDELNFLENLSKVGNEIYELGPRDFEEKYVDIIKRDRYTGGPMSGINSREDCVMIFDELQNARELLSHLRQTMSQYNSPPKEDIVSPIIREDSFVEIAEEYMSSKEWIKSKGIKSKKIDIFDLLNSLCFRHCDGIVTLVEPQIEEVASEVDPIHNLIVTHPLKKSTMVHAKYCKKFAHIRWRDGTLRHVQISPDVFREYESKMRVHLDAVKRRIKWLRHGSREIFGTIIESNMYILIDTSASMSKKLPKLKRKLNQLLYEQILHRQKVNFIHYNSVAHKWKERLIPVSQRSLEEADEWIQNLTASGTTNTMAAIQLALADRDVQALYLLTDGRPNQNPKFILQKLNLLKNVPIHTISFNCADEEANLFLLDLAKQTGGRFNYFSEILGDAKSPAPIESEDVQILQEEYKYGVECIDKLCKISEQCKIINRITSSRKNATSNSNRSHYGT